jgi:hypothetical protein
MGIVVVNANGRDATKDNNSTAVCYVGCKLPHGLICELGANTPEHAHVKLRGGRTNKLLGVGVTPAPRNFMERWLKVNKNLPYVENKQIWLADSEEAALAGAVGMVGMLTGFEALDGGQIPKEIEADAEHLRKMGVSVRGV